MSVLPLSGGGIFSLASADVIRRTSSLSAGLPGTTATAPDSSLAGRPFERIQPQIRPGASCRRSRGT